MPNEGMQGDERATSVALDTSVSDGTRDHRPGASRRVTEPPQSSARGKATSKAKGGRRTGAWVKTGAEMATAQSLDPGHRRAVCGESSHARFGEGRLEMVREEPRQSP